jgi:hypothetical protein
VRWNGQIVTGEPTTDGPGALWTTPFMAHLRPEWSFAVRSQTGISRAGIRHSGGVTAVGIVVVPRILLLDDAEHAVAQFEPEGVVRLALLVWDPDAPGPSDPPQLRRLARALARED